MTRCKPWWLLGTLLSAAGGAAVAAEAVDTSQWKCESCPYEQGSSGSVSVGVSAVSKSSARFGDYTGLDRSGGHLLASGDLAYRGADGLFADLGVFSLTPDAVSLSGVAGREGAYAVHFRYDEIQRHFSDTATTPFLGSGSSVLTLPGGFPAATSGAMPLADSLTPVELGTKRSQLDLGITLPLSDAWSLQLGGRHRVQDGTRRSAGSFYSTAAQLAAPVDQTTDELELSAAYAGRTLQATLAWRASAFRNADESLTWRNPFSAPGLTGTQGQLALAPDNQFQQLQAQLGWQPNSRVRASADVAIGRLTQDAAYLPATLNAALQVPSLPAASLDGRVDTLDANLRLAVQASERLRLNASWSRDERDNRTSSLLYPSVSTDLFIGQARSNPVYGFTRERARLSADYRGPGSLRVSAGADHDAHQRTQQEVGTTRETTLYARVAAQPSELLGLSLKLAHGDRSATAYRSVEAIEPAENPLLRKFNLAHRLRDSSTLRADLHLSERINLGLDVDLAWDDYPDSAIGLTSSRTQGLGADLSVAFSERTQLTLFAHGDRTASRQAGSQQFAQPDWWAQQHDQADLFGLGLRHAAIKDQLDVGADLVLTRSRSQAIVDTGASSPAFPKVTTALDSVKLFATWQLRKNLSMTGTWWIEHYTAKDWQLDGVLPATVPNLLAFGEQPSNATVNVLQLALRYRF